jgi:hypothetical protein
MTTPIVALGARQVHRAAFAPRNACRLAQQLGHDRLGIEPPCNGPTVVAIGRQQMVRIAQRLATARGDCLLADVQV